MNNLIEEDTSDSVEDFIMIDSSEEVSSDSSEDEKQYRKNTTKKKPRLNTSKRKRFVIRSDYNSLRERIKILEKKYKRLEKANIILKKNLKKNFVKDT